MTTEAQYRAVSAVRRQLTTQTLTVTESQTPTPTQEENDLARLGLLPDGPKAVAAPTMPPLHEQHAMVMAAETGTAQRAAPAPASHR